MSQESAVQLENNSYDTTKTHHGGESYGDSLISDGAKKQEESGPSDTADSLTVGDLLQQSKPDEIGIKHNPPDGQAIDIEKEAEENLTDMMPHSIGFVICSEGASQQQMIQQGKHSPPNAKLQEVVAHRVTENEVLQAIEEEQQLEGDQGIGIIQCDVLMDTDQQITLKLCHQDTGKDIIATFVYAKCDEGERLELWDSLYQLASDMNFPWMVGGDFNVILSEEEKLGGLPVALSECEDFAFCINSCGLLDMRFKGSPFTWWNGRSAEDCIFKRLDRIVVNWSDHAPLILSYGEEAVHSIKPFRFLNFWTQHETFREVVVQNWRTPYADSPFLAFKQKLKSLKGAISRWSRETYGDIFKQLAIREEVVKIKEDLFEEEPIIENRIVLQKAQAELKKYLSLEEQYWKQKAGFNWSTEGDRNTSFFHNYMNGRRKRLQVRGKHNGEGVWLEEMENIKAEAVNFFQNQFTQEGDASDFDILRHVPSMISHEQNMMLCAYPTKEEVKQAIFALSGDSAGGPDGFTDMRPISLSNFINKVISRVVHGRIERIFPSLISANQSGFVKGRSIFENILLTQEIVSDIRIRGKPANVVIKLDMAKAYDRVSWKYLLHVLRSMGFAEHFIGLIWRLISNNWYSVLLNGQATGFFHSTRGVKQGDSLSPTLFLLTAEVLSRALNSLFEESNYIGYGMPKWSYPLNHLAYADDTIIFTSAHPESLKSIMRVLNQYEQASGQLINKEKSSYYMYSKVGNTLIQSFADNIGISRGQFPFIYLGCTIFHSRKKKVYYAELIKKIKGRLHSWKGKLLSFGGKVVLIKSVLQAMPLHLLSVLAPPKCVLNEIHKIFARYFWINKEEGRNRHWVAWQNVCLPTQEGGLGFKSLFDISNALFAKLWWIFRTSNTLWANYMWNKYCKKQMPILVQWKGGSQVWKKMLEAREAIEHEIWWEIKGGTINVWYKNWTKLGALHHVVPTDFPINEALEDVADPIEGGRWKDQMLQQNFPTGIVDHIKSEIHIEQLQGVWDRPWWMPTSTGKFTINTAWDIMRHKSHIQEDFKQLWIKGVPFKISFFLWKLWKWIIPTDDNLMRINIVVVSRCYCCRVPQQETMQHLFLTSNFAEGVWKVFLEAAGLHVNRVQLHQTIRAVWSVACGDMIKPIVQAIPAMITWELWKRRNTTRHGGKVSFRKVVHEVNNNLYYLTRMRYPSLQNVPFLWPDLVNCLERIQPRIITKVVHWKLPYARWFKCNTNGASRGNPGPSSYGFCVRNWQGDLVYAQCAEIGDSTIVVAEAKAILQGLTYCVEHELHPLIMETDSLLLKKVVEEQWQILWCIITEVERIKKMMEGLNVIIQHVYREGNSLADFLANIAFDFAASAHPIEELAIAEKQYPLYFIGFDCLLEIRNPNWISILLIKEKMFLSKHFAKRLFYLVIK
ncbi:uncharacterized protein LOC132615077 [Lycium barbarum]|uniref:uncharacterized protein LOC132615077 n=1 Tax=Lycium barbarum TaxID=112863 RepID=UPI00293EF710|nr:uncharacterized protein LOC132615077 [Lycium barbarum]